MFPIRDLRGQGHRLRRAGARARTPRPNTSTRRRRRSSTRAASSTIITSPRQPRPRPRHGHRRRGLCRRHRDERRRLPARRSRRSARRSREDQLALLWRHGRRADPVLRRRQGRATGRLSGARCRPARTSTPGKSLRFALLPEGQDPDDLARSGGAAAIERVLAGGAAPRRHPLGAGDRGGAARYARAPGGARASPARILALIRDETLQAVLPRRDRDAGLRA